MNAQTQENHYAELSLVTETNVVSLTEARLQKSMAEESPSHEATAIAEAVCENGVCTLQWKPKRPSVAA